MDRTFIREIPLDKFTKEQEDYYRKQGLEIVITDDNTVTVWAS